MADLILDTPVDGIDAPIGRLTAVVCDPTTDEATHIVVEPDEVPGSERLVPIGSVAQQDMRITLDVTRHAFFGFPNFETARFMPDDASEADADVDRSVARWTLPFVRPAHPQITFAVHERIPKSEVALRRGTRVVDADGHHVGHVHAFVVDRTAQHVTHVVIDRSHVLRHRDVTVPIAAVERMGEHQLTLSIDTDALDALPHIAVA